MWDAPRQEKKRVPRVAMDLRHVTRAMAYFSNPAYLAAWDRYAKARKLPDFPVAVFKAVVCRHDLLFEFEADAVTS